MDFDTITVKDWQAFLNNNENINYLLENMYISILEIDQTTKSLAEPILTTYGELGKLKIMKVSNRGNVDSLYTILRSNQQLLANKIGESVTKIFLGLCCAETGINNYNIDEETKNYIKEVLKGNISEEDKAAIAIALSSYTPILAYAVTTADNKASVIEKFPISGAKVAGRKLIRKGFKSLYSDADSLLVKNAIGSSSAIFTATVAEMAIKYIYNDLDPTEYNAKDWIDIAGSSSMAVANYFVSAGLTASLGPAGIPISVGINAIINKVITPAVNYIGDLVTDNFVADTFKDENGQTYTIYNNGSGNHKSSAEILKKAKEQQKENNRLYYIKGQAVPKTKFENELYRNTNAFIEGEKKYINEDYITPGIISPAHSYSEFSDVWNDMKNEIKQCKSAQEVSEVYNKYNSSSDYRWQTIGGEDTMIRFKDLTENMEEEYGFDPITYWKYIKED